MIDGRRRSGGRGVVELVIGPRVTARQPAPGALAPAIESSMLGLQHL